MARTPSINPVSPRSPRRLRFARLNDRDSTIADSVSRETRDKLQCYSALVDKWTKSINLISRNDHSAIWERHVLDSLRLLPLIPDDAECGVDLGSGAGFPGLVLSLVTRIPFDLVEVDRRKAAFLVEAQRVTGAPVTVHCTRIEELVLPPVPLVTARALAPLSQLLEHANQLLRPGGTALFPKGARVDEEIGEARQNWRMRLNRSDSAQHRGSTILIITDLARA